MKKKIKFYYCPVCDLYIENKGTRVTHHIHKEIAPINKNNNHKIKNRVE